jgi:hypothetical protein
MSTLESYVPLIQAEAERLAQFLDTLSTDDLQRPSACELWDIHDVVAHLIWGADFYADSVSRGLQGDMSLPENRPPGDTSDAVPMSTYFAQHAIRLRQVLGDRRVRYCEAVLKLEQERAASSHQPAMLQSILDHGLPERVAWEQVQALLDVPAPSSTAEQAAEPSSGQYSRYSVSP